MSGSAPTSNPQAAGSNPAGGVGRKASKLASGEIRPTGHLQVKGARSGRRWHVLWHDGDGRHHRVLGPAHVEDSGRRTPRGAVVWRAGDGPKPTQAHLTPDEAADALRGILAGATRVPRGELRCGASCPTFDDAVREWLRYVESEKKPR
jgi:hypothetical protein